MSTNIFSKLSPKFSMAGWDLLTYLKGRKKTIVTMVGTVLGYVISNDEVIAILSGLAVECLFSIAEYYLSEIEN